MITRESVCDATEKASRDGMLALITPVITLTDGTLGCQHEVYPDRPPTSGRFCTIESSTIPAGHHHQVVELVDNHHDVGEPVVSILIEAAGVVAARDTTRCRAHPASASRS